MTRVKEDSFTWACQYIYRNLIASRTHKAVLETFEAVFKEELRPIILKKYETEELYWAMIHLPPGLTFSKFQDTAAEPIADATFGLVGIERVGKRITLKVVKAEIPETIPYEWNTTKHKDMFLPFVLGYDVINRELTVKDLAKAPHILIGGNTGGGKSNMLHNTAVSLLRSREVVLIIIDFKVLEFVYLSDHAVVVTNEDAARNVLRRLNGEMDRRLHKLARQKVVKIQNYKGNDMPYIVLIIDELAELRDEESLELLNRLLRLCRAAGISVVCATQRPSSTALKDFGDSKLLFGGRICFRMPDEVNSRIVLDNGSAAKIPDIPGRCIISWGKDYEVQTMFLPPDDEAVIQPLLAEAKIRKVGWLDGIEQPRKRLAARPGHIKGDSLNENTEH